MGHPKPNLSLRVNVSEMPHSTSTGIVPAGLPGMKGTALGTHMGACRASSSNPRTHLVWKNTFSILEFNQIKHYIQATSPAAQKLALESPKPRPSYFQSPPGSSWPRSAQSPAEPQAAPDPRGDVWSPGADPTRGASQTHTFVLATCTMGKKIKKKGRKIPGKDST